MPVTNLQTTQAPSIEALIVYGQRAQTLRRALERQGHHAVIADARTPLDELATGAEAVIIAAPRDEALTICKRLKTRFQVPLLPVLVLVQRPTRLPAEPHMPDAWLGPSTRSRDVVARVEELVRIRRTESELVRLNLALADLAAENGRLYERARREAAATTLLLRELQHRVRNNLASIQALLVLERHRAPPRPLGDALDVAIGRLRSMAALQDALTPGTAAVPLAHLAHSIARGVFDVFGASDAVRYHVEGDTTVSARDASAIALVLNELVTNALKHSGAHEISVRVATDHHRLIVFVEDDGRGMPTQPPAGSGLKIARAVARNELAGELTFDPVSDGTRARLSLPLEGSQPEQGTPQTVP
jgi:two-component sensor histidine kinase